MTSPVGAMIVDVEKKAAKKAGRQHEEQAECGCQVEVSWFSSDSRRVRIDRCIEHALNPARTISSASPGQAPADDET